LESARSAVNWRDWRVLLVLLAPLALVLATWPLAWTSAAWLVRVELGILAWVWTLAWVVLAFVVFPVAVLLLGPACVAWAANKGLGAVLHGYPVRFGAVHFVPWIRLGEKVCAGRGGSGARAGTDWGSGCTSGPRWKTSWWATRPTSGTRTRCLWAPRAPRWWGR
jgi:hypothetical protein